MKFDAFYRTLERNRYFVFSLADVCAFFPGVERGGIANMLHRWRVKGMLNSLKKGLYELAYPSDREIPDLFVANRLYGPSYVSLETALSRFSIVPEVSMAVTSITTKPTRSFKNKHGLFIYRTVRPEAFTGYFIERHRDAFDVLMAEPEKALVDYIHFKTYADKEFDFSGERLDKSAILRLNQAKLNRYARLYGIDLRRFHAFI